MVAEVTIQSFEPIEVPSGRRSRTSNKIARLTTSGQLTEYPAGSTLIGRRALRRRRIGNWLHGVSLAEYTERFHMLKGLGFHEDTIN